jgi:hypothetical protein
VIVDYPISNVVGGVDFGGFPPRSGGDPDPNRRKVCATKLFEWMAEVGFEFSTYDGPNALKYTNPAHPDVEITFKPEPAKRTGA